MGNVGGSRGRTPNHGRERRFPSVTAHAGALDTVPNTRASFDAALAHPVDYLEADVCIAPGGAPYLSHDPLPPDARADAMPLSELLALAAAHPTVRLNLDMKETVGLGSGAAMVRASGLVSRVLLTGIERRAMPAVRSDAPDLAYLLNAFPTPTERWTRRGAEALCREIRECGARGLNTHHSALTRGLAHALAAAGLSISVWTVDGTNEMRRMLRLAVDNITTRRVDRLLALKEEAA